MFEARVFRYETPHSGSISGSMQVVRTALLGLGFEVEGRGESQLYAVGPGMHSNQQPELLGVSELWLDISDGKVRIEAILGAVAKFKKFVALFPPLLIISLYIPAALFDESVDWTIGLWGFAWIFLAIPINRALDSRTERAVARLARGMAQADG